MSQETQSPVQPPQEITLGAFLDENQKSLAVLGVFAALGVIWKTSAIDDKMPVIAYLCFFITVPIFWEVMSRGYRAATGHWRLTWFLIVLNLIFYQAVITILFGWPEHAGQWIMIVIWLALFSIGGRFVSGWESSRVDKRYKQYLAKFNAVPTDDPKRREKQKQISLDYVTSGTGTRLLDIVPTIILILLILMTVVLGSDFFQAVIDYSIRAVTPAEVPSINSVER